MPQQNERYNRFMKHCNMAYHEGKINDDVDWKTMCEICYKLKWRNAEMVFKAGQVICKEHIGEQ